MKNNPEILSTLLDLVLQCCNATDTFYSRVEARNETKKGNEMSYSKACEILGFTTPKSFKANAGLATSRLRCLAANAPLRYKVACQVLINAAK